MWVSRYANGTMYSQSSESSYSFYVYDEDYKDIELVSNAKIPITDRAEWYNMDDVPEGVQHRIECIVNAI